MGAWAFHFEAIGGDRVAEGETRCLSCYRMTLVLAVLLVIVAVSLSKVFAAVFILTALVFSFKHPAMGLVGWIMGYPYFSVLTDSTGVLGYFVLSPLVGSALFSLIARKISIHVSAQMALSGLALAGVASLSLVLSRNPQTGLVALGMLIVALFIVVVVVAVVKQYPESLPIMNEAYVLAVVSVFLSTLLTDSLFGVGRLSLGDSIRRIANVTSPALIFLYLELILRPMKREIELFSRRRPTLVVLILLGLSVVVLLSTVSRGALMAVVATALLTLVYVALFIRPRLNPVKALVTYAAGSSIVIWAIGFVRANMSGNYLARIRVSSFGDNVRWDIWRKTIEQMNAYEYLIGVGPGKFRELALLGGYDHYAHSVFIDTFVSLGIIGLVLLSGFLVALLFSSVRKKDIYAFAVTVLMIWLYSTHGNLTGSLDFWTLSALACASLACRNPSCDRVHDLRAHTES